MNYDLEERTSKFGENVISFLGSLPKSDINRPLVSQLVRSATSIGANYMEANEASSKKDFRNKITICRKESNESKHWLRMVAHANSAQKEKCKQLWKESHELTLIFSKIVQTCSV
ncbi:MAG: four helix bundle protein [Candidatus Taylorbacteria bacterium CG11_big_fil_rev_8_21_14_0_20_46_11]|uniref:Four helix bundle protein n=1 Tax=Candidatus Taylorbacteria bacterium CG11_big_fil_rev_8_21_14_0_20_46_11 TaxID=1975025 RepID=A0A2H0KAC2_9BACT|nr:MAG: four helix bundle protein [Candidatus Taylorbacteria bacterium CG11_big_fil_rev_8_21_14_0_20_46_11]